MLLTANPTFLDAYQVEIFTAAECDRIVAEAEQSNRWSAAGIYSGTSQSITPRERSVMSTPLEGDERTWPLSALLENLAEANDRVFRYRLETVPAHDRPSVLRYEAGSADHFRSHRDAGRGAPTRKLTFSVQLSDPSEYQGCDLIMNDRGSVASKQRGTLIAFPSFELHHVTPVVSGRRYVIVGWVHGPTFA